MTRPKEPGKTEEVAGGVQQTVKGDPRSTAGLEFTLGQSDSNEGCAQENATEDTWGHGEICLSWRSRGYISDRNTEN